MFSELYMGFLNGAVAILFTCCVCTANHTLLFAHVSLLYLKMDSFVLSAAVDQPTELWLDSGGNQSFNGTNMTVTVIEPCINCVVVTPFYLPTS